jgi:hypothetical protein
MSSHVHHHFVPRFLLEEWAGADRKLTVFRWAGGRLLESRCSPKAVAKVQHLYSLNRSSREPDVQLEKAFFGPQLDGLAAPIHRLLLTSGVAAVSNEQRVDWSRFLLAQMIRVPAPMAFIRRLGRDHVLEQFRRMAANAGRPEAADIWLQPERRDTLDDEGMKSLRRFIDSPEFNRDIVLGEWAVITIGIGDVDTLLSDNPLAYLGDLRENAFMLMLPLSPRKLFVCASTTSDLAKATTNEGRNLVKATNRQLVKQAGEYVYASGAFHEPLVRKHLRRPA